MSDADPIVIGPQLTPGIVAEDLGVSGAALRRMAAAYEKVYGPLPEGAAGRLWPVEAVERLRDARKLIAGGRARSVQGALQLLRSGATLPVEAPWALKPITTGPGELVAELRALRGEVEAMRSELSELRALPPAPTPAAEAMSERAGEQRADGALVRVARWLEQMLGRR